jgi:hypothetical protein
MCTRCPREQNHTYSAIVSSHQVITTSPTQPDHKRISSQAIVDESASDNLAPLLHNRFPHIVSLSTDVGKSPDDMAVIEYKLVLLLLFQPLHIPSLTKEMTRVNLRIPSLLLTANLRLNNPSTALPPIIQVIIRHFAEINPASSTSHLFDKVG